MKSYPLSSPGEKIAGAIISLILLLCIGVLMKALGGDILSLIICILASLLVAAALAFYLANLYKAACIPDPEGRRLQIRGFPDWTADLSGSVCVETAAFKNGPVAARTLVFTDADGKVTASVPTFFTANQGAQAEPLAMELAAVLGLTFKPTLEPWEYDKEKRKEHQKELTRAEKEKRRENFRALKEKILRKRGPAVAEPLSSEEEAEDTAELESDGINYDAMDDEK